MKTAKKLTALFLCLAMLLSVGVIGAGAIEKGDEIEFTYTDDDGDTFNYIYSYQGTLTEGLNSFPNNYDYEAYSFDAEKAGYYYVVSSFCSVDIAEKCENNTASGRIKQEDWLHDSNSNIGSLFYLPAGTSVFLINNRAEYYSSSVYIEYYGEFESFSVPDKEVCYLSGYDFGIIETDNNGSTQYEYYFYPFALDFHFSNGKTLFSDRDFSEHFYSDSKMVNGENVLIADFVNEKLQIKLDLYEISYFVEKMEFSNIDKYLNYKEYYNGECEYPNYGSYDTETVTVTFTDSTKKDFEYFVYYDMEIIYTSIALPNGKTFMPDFCFFPTKNGTKKLVVFNSYFKDFSNDCYEDSSLETVYFEADCTATKASLSENLMLLKKNITYHIEDIPSLIRWNLIGMLEAYDSADAMKHFIWLFVDPAYEIRDILNEISLFFKNAF